MNGQSLSSFSLASFQMHALNGGGTSFNAPETEEGVTDGISLSPKALALLAEA